MNIAIFLCAGSSTRAGKDKIWAKVHGKPLWTLAYETLHEHTQIDQIFIVIKPGTQAKWELYLKEKGEDLKTKLVLGRGTRMESFEAGVQALLTEQKLTKEDVVLDVNGASPCITYEEISKAIRLAHREGASAVAHEVVDTVAEIEKGQFLEDNCCRLLRIKERSSIRLMQTPQAIRGDVLLRVVGHFNKTIGSNPKATDLSSALLSQNIFVKMVPAHPFNKKITFVEDLEELQSHCILGEDSHAFSSEGSLTLGGLVISDCPAMQANSDGDVILHAIGRALAQATSKSFSRIADKACQQGDLNSKSFIQPFLEKVKILGVSISIEGARPRIDPIISELKQSLSATLKISASVIYISAHTGETLSAFGRGEGLRCTALVKVLPR